MNLIKIVLAFLLAGVFAGCGGEPPPGASHDAAMADATPVVDVSTPVDNGTDRDVVPTGDQPGACRERIDRVGRFTCNNGVEVCIPDVQGGEHLMCTGAAMCQPNDVNPTCAGAQSCACTGTLSTYQMQLICNGNSACESTVRQMIPNLTCSPGHNRCSVNLPDGVEYAPFFDQEGGRETLRNILTRYHWYFFEGGMTMDDPRTINTGTKDIYTPSGLVQLCLWTETGCLECVGNTCYSRRSTALRSVSDSFEIRFAHQCRFEVLRFSPGSDEPTFRAEFVAVPCQP